MIHVSLLKMAELMNVMSNDKKRFTCRKGPNDTESY
jgi:hypothetical protein